MAHERFDFVENVFEAMYSEGSDTDEDTNARVCDSSGDESVEAPEGDLGGRSVKGDMPADKG